MFLGKHMGRPTRNYFEKVGKLKLTLNLAKEPQNHFNPYVKNRSNDSIKVKNC